MTATAIRPVPVHLDVPEQHRARVLWVLNTLLAPCDARVALERDPARAADARARDAVAVQQHERRQRDDDEKGDRGGRPSRGRRGEQRRERGASGE